MTGIVQVAANASFAMALKQDGSAVAWGKNDLGQLGNGSFTDSASPVPVTGLGSASQLAAGRSQAFAILKDSTLRAWGNNGNEQLGISTAKPHFPAMQLVPDAADTNANALPDAWEQTRFGNLTTPMWEDADGDGLTNVEEFHLGTDPKSANSDGDLFSDLADARPLTADPEPAPVAALVSGNNQRILPGSTTAQPLELLLTRNGQPMVNMPVIARVSAGKLAATAGAALFSENALLVRTDAEGKARIWLQAPASEGAVQVAFDTLPAPVVFNAVATLDIDANGLRDSWELEHFGALGQDPAADPDGDGLTNRQEFEQGADPKDYYNGQVAQIVIVSGNNQRALPGAMLAQPVVIKVARNGAAFANAPVRFSAERGVIAATRTGTGVAQLELRTDASGLASIYYTLPNAEGVAAVAIQAGSAMASATATATYDTDANGLRDSWELEHFGAIGQDPAADPDGDGISNLQEFQGGGNPKDYYNQGGMVIVPALSIASGNSQRALPGSRLAQPIVVSVLRSGTAMANAPVTFSVTVGGLAASASAAPLAAEVTVRTNASGQASIYYTLPNAEGVAAITVKAGTATASATATATFDTDGNGLRDSWELEHFGALGQDPAADPDGDGLSNLDELAFGLNPVLNSAAQSEMQATFGYDRMGRLLSNKEPTATAQTISVDAEGNITSIR